MFFLPRLTIRWDTAGKDVALPKHMFRNADLAIYLVIESDMTGQTNLCITGTH
jgi:hypothetical protein